MQVRRPGRGGVSRRVLVFSQPLRVAFPTIAKTEKYEFYKFLQEKHFYGGEGGVTRAERKWILDIEHLADT